MPISELKFCLTYEVINNCAAQSPVKNKENDGFWFREIEISSCF